LARIQKQNISGHLLLFPVFAAVKTATANIAPLENILTPSAADTEARAASKALIVNFPQNTPSQEPSEEPKYQ
jgi:hypothetical protein